MEEDDEYDGPQDLDATVQEIDALYLRTIPPLQGALRDIQSATGGGSNGPLSILSKFLEIFAFG